MIAVLLCGFANGCSSTLNAGGVKGVIFPANKAHFVAHATGRKELQYWTPAQSDVAKAMSHTKAFLAKEAPSISIRLQKYRCQFFGVVIEGRKRIYCNFFDRDSRDEHWRSKPVFVLDGGDSYFQLEYEVETEQCLNFVVNGEA